MHIFTEGDGQPLSLAILLKTIESKILKSINISPRQTL